MKRKSTQVPVTLTTSCRGFTLIEVLVALTVVVALTTIFTATVPAARKAASVNGQYSQAISLCQHKIDQMRAVGYGRINYDELEPLYIDDSRTTPPYNFAEVDQVADYLHDPTATLDVDSIPGRPNEVLVTATITWGTTTHESKRSSMSLSAVIANVE